MYKVNVNGAEINVEVDGSKQTVNGKPFEADIIEFKKGHFHIIRNLKSYTAEVVEFNAAEKSFVIKVNNHEYRLSVKDKYDELLHQMGFDTLQSKKGGDIKAPMPGLVLDVMIEVGQQIKAGDTILILQAMKMENTIKAQADGEVKKILVAKDDKVEKNQVLVTLI
jgi:biotin carboxyl carrier protein